jgi:PTS system mannitol-specific IIC component
LENADIVITQTELSDRAKAKLPSARHLSIGNFMDAGFYDKLVAELT